MGEEGEHETLRANLLCRSGRDWLLLFFGAYPTSFCFGAFALVPQAFWQQDEALDPIDVGFFSADGMMFGSDGTSDTVKQFLFAALCHDPPNLRFPLCCCSKIIKIFYTLCPIESSLCGQYAR